MPHTRRAASESAHESVHEPNVTLQLHRHTGAYAALVLDGGYVEHSIDGRHACVTGDLVIHPRYHAHHNCFSRAGATVFNLPLPTDFDAEYVVLKVACYEQIERMARHDPTAAVGAALEEMSYARRQATAPHWMGRIAGGLRADCESGACTSIGHLATTAGISPQHASRAFASHFGMSPSRFRTEHRLRRALMLLRAGMSPATAALRTGFTDQSHLTRMMKARIGMTPRQASRARQQG